MIKQCLIYYIDSYGDLAFSFVVNGVESPLGLKGNQKVIDKLNSILVKYGYGDINYISIIGKKLSIKFMNTERVDVNFKFIDVI